jgi:hypothetical protein
VAVLATLVLPARVLAGFVVLTGLASATLLALTATLLLAAAFLLLQLLLRLVLPLLLLFALLLRVRHFGFFHRVALLPHGCMDSVAGAG